MKIQLDKINLKYSEYQVFDQLNWFLDFKEYPHILLLGASGVGKSTLLHIIGGEHLHYEGNIFLNEKILKHPNDMHVPGYGHCAIIGQKSNLRVDYTLKENLAYQLRAYKEEYRQYRSDYLIEAAGLTAIKDHKVKLLSGGEIQRGGIVCALADMPDLLLMDEPLNQLNAAHKLKMQTLIAKELRDSGAKSIHVTHNVDDIYGHDGGVAVLNAADKINFYKSFQQLKSNPKCKADVEVFSFLNETIDGGNMCYFYPEDVVLNKVDDGGWKVDNKQVVRGKSWLRLLKGKEEIWVESDAKSDFFELEISKKIQFTNE